MEWINATLLNGVLELTTFCLLFHDHCMLNFTGALTIKTSYPAMTKSHFVNMFV